MGNGNDPAECLRKYVEKFNRDDNEIYPTYIPNSGAYEWMVSHVPLVSIPDKELEEVYYFRWWTFRKHIKKTETGFVITEFLPPVDWAGKYNTISCACAHHLKEGRWLRNEPAIDAYIRYWYRESDNFNSYSHWFEYSLYELCLLRNDFSIALENLDGMITWYQRREQTNFSEDLGLFWGLCDRDGMEFSVSGDGFRPTLNCYMCANAFAISEFAELSGRTADAELFLNKSRTIKKNIEKYLWSPEHRFYMSIHCPEKNGVPDLDRKDLRFTARELWGYLPWYFNLKPGAELAADNGIAPDGREDVFNELHDTSGFFASRGLTSAEQRHPFFGCFYTGEELNRWLVSRGQKPVGPKGHECLWNGPVWPYAVSLALTALARIEQPGDGLFYELLKMYAASHRLGHGTGSKRWIDEVMHPETGDWISRTRLKEWSDDKTWDKTKGGVERGKDYNHSTFCDLVISGLFGVSVEGKELKARPLFPANWEYASLYHIPFNGHLFTVTYENRHLQILPEKQG